MKKQMTLQLAAACCLVLMMSGCIKDTATRTYTYTLYQPVYKTSDEVRANIKNTAPQPITAQGKIYVLGNYIFLNDAGKGIHIINNSNPENPINEAYINIPGCEDISAYGNTLYADCFTDLMIIDISNPKAISLKKSISNIFPDRQYVLGYQIDSGRVIADWIIKDTTVTEAMETGSFFGGVLYMDALSMAYNSSSGGSKANPGVGKGGSMARFAIQASHLYTVTTSKLNALDIANPENPVWKNSLDLGWGIETIYPFKDKLFIGSSTGMQIISVSNPNNPAKVGIFTHARVCDPVIADDNYAYVTLRNGTECGGFINQMDVLDISNISSPAPINSYPFANPHGLSKDGNWLFVCDGNDGLKVLDATDPSHIMLKSSVAMSDTYDVITLGGIAIVSAKDGLYQYDYSDIENLKLVSKIGIAP